MNSTDPPGMATPSADGVGQPVRAVKFDVDNVEIVPPAAMRPFAECNAAAALDGVGLFVKRERSSVSESQLDVDVDNDVGDGYDDL